MNETGKNYLRSNNWWRVNILLDYCWTFGLQLSGYFTDFKKIRFIFLDFKKNRFDAVFFTILARTWLCFPVTRRRDNAISTHQKILTIYSLQDDKTHSNYVNTRNKNLIIQSYRSTSLKFLFVLCS